MRRVLHEQGTEPFKYARARANNALVGDGAGAGYSNDFTDIIQMRLYLATGGNIIVFCSAYRN
jgi:hypothetical protein